MNGTIVERLRRNARVCVDSMTFIYFIEAHQQYLPVVRDLFWMIDQGMINAFSSYLTLLEVLVQPLKENRVDLVNEYKSILLSASGFQLLPINGDIAERGAEIRARYGFRTPDALQLATALCNGAGAFVTNDTRLRRFRELEVVLLEDFVV